MDSAMSISSVWSLGLTEPKCSTFSFWIGSMTAGSIISTLSGIPASHLRELSSVAEHAPKQGVATDANPYYAPETMVAAGAALRQAGVQFLRAGGDATAAYTGVLAVTMHGLDVMGRADG